ncbi:DJ-1/YajL/PfpI superfamily [Vibrio maritimus]|uniref:DJ-1/YajL/PfpI superfamily n=1 Tax=Vibrio maritimus TaxID=990268 RepID=A0A090S4E6_9VIBR|nr:DJ-1/YajL/PfpI superfamily [Vibrio maritimus]
MTKKVLVPIAPGTEEMEAITIIDIMVRAGFEVTVASADFDGALTMKASRGVTLTADCKLVDVADDEFDVIALPGASAVLKCFVTVHYWSRWFASTSTMENSWQLFAPRLLLFCSTISFTQMP